MMDAIITALVAYATGILAALAVAHLTDDIIHLLHVRRVGFTPEEGSRLRTERRRIGVLALGAAVVVILSPPGGVPVMRSLTDYLLMVAAGIVAGTCAFLTVRQLRHATGRGWVRGKGGASEYSTGAGVLVVHDGTAVLYDATTGREVE